MFLSYFQIYNMDHSPENYCANSFSELEDQPVCEQLNSTAQFNPLQFHDNCTKSNAKLEQS